MLLGHVGVGMYGLRRRLGQSRWTRLWEMGMGVMGLGCVEGGPGLNKSQGLAVGGITGTAKMNERKGAPRVVVVFFKVQFNRNLVWDAERYDFISGRGCISSGHGSRLGQMVRVRGKVRRREMVRRQFYDDITDVILYRDHDQGWSNGGGCSDVITNGKFESSEHRVVTSSKESRYTIASFIYPHSDTVIVPEKSLFDKDNMVRRQFYDDITDVILYRDHDQGWSNGASKGCDDAKQELEEPFWTTRVKSRWSQGDFHHWLDLFNHFDTYFEKYIKPRRYLQLEDDFLKHDPPFPREAVFQILRVVRIILEDCTNRHFYSSYQLKELEQMSLPTDAQERKLIRKATRL
ncbi:E3 ubiquitin protein ligase UPL1-like protein [Tanacetum coccineum]